MARKNHQKAQDNIVVWLLALMSMVASIWGARLIAPPVTPITEVANNEERRVITTPNTNQSASINRAPVVRTRSSR